MADSSFSGVDNGGRIVKGGRRPQVHVLRPTDEESLTPDPYSGAETTRFGESGGDRAKADPPTYFPPPPFVLATVLSKLQRV